MSSRTADPPARAGSGRRAPTQGTIRRLLLLGFGLIFALWAVWGYDFIVQLAEVRERTAAVNDRYSKAEQLVGTIRAQMLLGSLYLRDMLLEVPAPEPSGYPNELHTCRANVERAILEYLPIVDSPREREMFMQLRGEIADFWDTVLPILEWSSSRRTAEARTLLHQQVIPKRETIIRIARSVQNLNRSAFAERQHEAARIFGGMQRQVAVTGGLALFLSVAVAALVLISTGRLEGRIRQQQARDAQNARDLQRLSARLATAQEEERRVIARELHDEVGQALTAIKMELSLAQRELQGSARSEGRLDGAQRITDRTLQSVRDLSRLLHPPLLDDLGLATALSYDVRDFSRRTGVRAEFIHENMDEHLAPELEISAYRIVQEALTNVARHAAAATCRVSLRRASGVLHLSVEDDGRGFDAAGTSRSHDGLGLLSMQERVSALHGRMRLETAPGKGTRLMVELPAGIDAARAADPASAGVGAPLAAAERAETP
jgi:signal transduction histidine kinase